MYIFSRGILVSSQRTVLYLWISFFSVFLWQTIFDQLVSSFFYWLGVVQWSFASFFWQRTIGTKNHWFELEVSDDPDLVQMSNRDYRQNGYHVYEAEKNKKMLVASFEPVFAPSESENISTRTCAIFTISSLSIDMCLSTFSSSLVAILITKTREMFTQQME